MDTTSRKGFHVDTGQLRRHNDTSLNFLCPRKSTLYHKMHPLPVFHSLPRPPPSLTRQPRCFPSLLRSQGQLKCPGSDGRKWMNCLQLLSLSCHSEHNQWKIITKAHSHDWRRHTQTGGPFQVADGLADLKRLALV